MGEPSAETLTKYLQDVADLYVESLALENVLKQGVLFEENEEMSILEYRLRLIEMGKMTI